MKKIFKVSRQVLAAALLSFSLLGATHAFAKETTTADLRLIEDKFRTLDAKDEKAAMELLASASEAVGSMPKAKSQKLDTLQVKELIELLKVSKKFDTYNRIVDDNSELISANKKAIGLELKKLAPKDAKEISETIEIVMAGDEASDNYEGMGKEKAAKPAKKK
jgi:hypothetical protein